MKNICLRLRNKPSRSAGFSLVEALVGLAILLLVTTVLLSIFVLHLRITSGGPERLAAGYLMYEGVEALRTIRDQGWEDNIGPLDVDQEYYLTFDSDSGWSLTTDLPPLIDGRFRRTIEPERVYRDSDDNIVEPADGIEDPGSRRFIIRVQWDDFFGSSDRTVTTYLTDLFMD